MAETLNPARWLGKRYVTDFRIVAIGASETGEAEATLLMYGDTYKISVEELSVIVERGFVTEAPIRGET